MFYRLWVKTGAAITWESSNEYYIGNDGSVFIPTPDRGDQSVTLTANIELNGERITKDFTVNLQARPALKMRLRITTLKVR
jgi:arabinan endo-1,5-alpha-L-arabinosidase